MQRPLPHDEHRGIPADPDEGSGSAPEAGPPPASETDPPFIEPTYEPVPPPPPVPPNALRPWYYREWFLVPTFLWWPCSAILLLRSPWHNGVLTGALSWAWIIIGGGFIFLRLQINLHDTGNIFIGLVNEQPKPDWTMPMLAAPGLLLTILTQSMWLTQHRPRIRRIRAAGGFADYASAPEPVASARPPRQQTTGPRRRPNRGGTRSRRRRH